MKEKQLKTISLRGDKELWLKFITTVKKKGEKNTWKVLSKLIENYLNKNK